MRHQQRERPEHRCQHAHIDAVPRPEHVVEPSRPLGRPFRPRVGLHDRVQHRRLEGDGRLPVAHLLQRASGSGLGSRCSRSWYSTSWRAFRCWWRSTGSDSGEPSSNVDGTAALAASCAASRRSARAAASASAAAAATGSAGRTGTKHEAARAVAITDGCTFSPTAAASCWFCCVDKPCTAFNASVQVMFTGCWRA